MKEIDDALNSVKKPLVDKFFESKFFKEGFGEELLSGKND